MNNRYDIDKIYSNKKTVLGAGRCYTFIVEYYSSFYKLEQVPTFYFINHKTKWS